MGKTKRFPSPPRIPSSFALRARINKMVRKIAKLKPRRPRQAEHPGSASQSQPLGSPQTVRLDSNISPVNGLESDGEGK